MSKHRSTVRESDVHANITLEDLGFELGAINLPSVVCECVSAGKCRWGSVCT